MHPLLVELSRKFDRLRTAEEIAAALSEREDACESFPEVEQEAVSGSIERLHERLQQARP